MNLNFTFLKSSFLCLFCTINTWLVAQHDPTILHASKFIKLNDQVYAVKKAKDLLKVASLYFVNVASGELTWSSTYSGRLYPNYTWDLEGNYWVGERNSKYGTQYEQHDRAITFLQTQEWLSENEFDTIANYAKLQHQKLKKRDQKKHSPYRNIGMFVPSTQKHIVSQRFNGISSFYTRRLMHDYPLPIRYDWAMTTNYSFLMPVLFQDSIHFYHFNNNAWQSPDYVGADANGANDKWSKERIVPFKQALNGQFRFFLLQNEAFFLANADTVLYKLDADKQRMDKVGSIKKKTGQQLNYLMDKDASKLYFINIESLELEEKEKSRFEMLKPTNPLYAIVQKLIAATEDTTQHKSAHYDR